MQKKKILFVITKATWGEALRSWRNFGNPRLPTLASLTAILYGELPFPDPLTRPTPL